MLDEHFFAGLQGLFPVAAERFNRFFYNLVERVADADRRPAFLGPNPYRGR